MTESQKPGPLAPSIVSRISTQTPDHNKADTEVVGRRIGLALVAAAIPVVWFWPAVDLFLEGKIVGGLTAVVVASFTVMVWWSSDQMQRVSVSTLTHLEREFEADHRPWIAVSVEPHPSAPLQFLPDGKCRIDLQIGYENTGGVPAIELRLRWKFVPPCDDAVAVQHSLFDQPLPSAITSVFPTGKAATVRVACMIMADEWREWYDANPDKITTTEPHVVGIVTYRSPLDERADYVTGFIREVHRGGDMQFRPIQPSKGSVYDVILSGSNLGSGPIT